MLKWILYLLKSDLLKGPKQAVTLPNPKQKKAGTYMNPGDKVIAVGVGRKTKELNDGDIERAGDRTPGFSGLVSDMVVMTVKGIEGDKIRTPFYLFHKDDLHLVDTGRAAAAL